MTSSSLIKRAGIGTENGSSCLSCADDCDHAFGTFLANSRHGRYWCISDSITWTPLYISCPPPSLSNIDNNLKLEDKRTVSLTTT